MRRACGRDRSRDLAFDGRKISDGQVGKGRRLRRLRDRSRVVQAIGQAHRRCGVGDGPAVSAASSFDTRASREAAHIQTCRLQPGRRSAARDPNRSIVFEQPSTRPRTGRARTAHATATPGCSCTPLNLQCRAQPRAPSSARARLPGAARDPRGSPPPGAPTAAAVRIPPPPRRDPNRPRPREGRLERPRAVLAPDERPRGRGGRGRPATSPRAAGGRQRRRAGPARLLRPDLRAARPPPVRSSHASARARPGPPTAALGFPLPGGTDRRRRTRARARRRGCPPKRFGRPTFPRAARRGALANPWPIAQRRGFEAPLCRPGGGRSRGAPPSRAWSGRVRRPVRSPGARRSRGRETAAIVVPTR